MTAYFAEFDSTDAARHVAQACETAVAGRRAMRAVTRWCERFELSEPEFQVLWRLRDAADLGLDQTTIARVLAFSPAQVSSTVERLRAANWILHQAADGDRRRNLWRLSEGGRAVIRTMLEASAELKTQLECHIAPSPNPSPEDGGGEVAANRIREAA